MESVKTFKNAELVMVANLEVYKLKNLIND